MSLASIGKDTPPKYEYYDKTVTTGFVASNSFLPIKYTKTTYNELQKQTIKNDTELLIKTKTKDLEDMLLLKAGGNILNIKSDVREIIGGYRIDVFVEAYMLLNA